MTTGSGASKEIQWPDKFSSERLLVHSQRPHMNSMPHLNPTDYSEKIAQEAVGGMLALAGG